MTIPIGGGTAHQPVAVIQSVTHTDLTTAPSEPIKAPDGFNVEEHVLDHAGAYYDWFDDVSMHPSGMLLITGAAEYAEDLINFRDHRDSRLRTFTPDQVWAVILDKHKLAQEVIPGSYTANYYDALVREDWDDADGDMNVIDSLLQQLAFGEVVFG